MASWYQETYRYPQVPYTRGEGSSLQSSLSPPGFSHASPSEEIDHEYALRRESLVRRSVWMPFTVDPELHDGMTFFKIGDAVRVRRYFSKEKKYSSWIPGCVERPVLATQPGGRTSRKYAVSYIDPYSGQVKMKDFDPALKEITPIPTLHTHDSLPHTESPMKRVVFVLIAGKTSPGRRPPCPVWTPALLLRLSNHSGLQARILAGPSQNQHVYGIDRVIPYSPLYAAEFKRQGHAVEGDGIQKFDIEMSYPSLR
ncbi:hypothetical protein BDN72DRAFT_956583 [Pluteus cervinus]|uniref:Uncharacterized protein n=1 Tax=Pluteus cervinus TaxID=181527 RepID=A0ACD3B6V3_9AGAR|nr:hypothetical protein BDN72DRAFT_956583 [Pluteus cervinus]